MIGHASDCAVHNAPAIPVGPCDCGASDGDYLRRAIEDGEATVIMDIVRRYDDVVALLGLQDDETPAADEMRRRFPELAV